MKVLLVALAAVGRASNWGEDSGAPAGFDCGMRRLAYEFGRSLVPRLGSFEALYSALDLASESCHVDLAEGIPPTTKEEPAVVDNDDTKAGFFLFFFYVAVDGDDDGPGTAEAPWKSVQVAVDRASLKSARGRRKKAVVVLKGGTYYLREPLVLTARHSGVSVVASAGERPVISGGVEVTIEEWTLVDSAKNIWSAPCGDLAEVPGLHIGGARLTRARYPNLPRGIEVSPGYDAVIPSKEGAWVPPLKDVAPETAFYTDANAATLRNETAGGTFQRYMIGTGGPCAIYDPPVSYWCSEHPAGGGAFRFKVPRGVFLTNRTTLPNAPYADPETALIHVWRPSRWANWMFTVAASDGAQNYTFGRGGFQGARGSDHGGDFHVENVFEELDHPGEFFFDAKARVLYIAHNGTGAPPLTEVVVVPQLRVLVNASASQFDPVRDVTLQGLEFRATRYTYMDPHGVPSAGDWALDRTAAVFAQGTERFTVQGCTFDRLDGNGLMLSGYTRNATVRDSDFSYLGANAVASWGYTNETAADPGRPGIHLRNSPNAGVDGTDGEHPRYTVVTGCTAREVGLYEKQSSFYVQAKTAQSTITGNVFFNGPRAGINMNDGFGGGDEVSHNLVFSTCRESGDHGPFNSWDRQPFLTTVRSGEPSMVMAWRHIFANFFIDNYSPQENIDNDDGSCYYKSHDNVLVYGNNGMKNDFDGHDNWHYSNLYAYAAKALNAVGTLRGHEDRFFGNRAVLTGDSVGSPQCGPAPATVMRNNEYYTASGTIFECGLALADWQALDPARHDPGSTVATTPDDATLLQWARDMLFPTTPSTPPVA